MRKVLPSRFLTRAMLALFSALCAAVLLLAVSQGGRDIVIFLCALAAVAGLLLLLPAPARRLARLGPLRCWLLLSVLCLAVKLFWILNVQVPRAGDYAVFWDYAQKLSIPGPIEGGRYMALFPHIFGYSSFLGLLMRLFGPGEFLAQTVNVLLTLLGGTALFHACRRLLSLEAAISAYLFWIVCPSQTIYNSLVLSEPLYTALILVLFALVAELDHRADGLRRPVAVGGGAGACCGFLLRWINTIRPIAAIPIIALFIWVLLLRRREGRRLWLPLLGVLLAVYLACGPLWSGHIARRLGEEPASSSGYSIAVGFNQSYQGSWNPEDSQLLFSYNDQPGATAQWVQEQMMAEAKQRILSKELDLLPLLRSKLSTFLASDSSCVHYSREVLAHTQLFNTLCDCFHYALLLLALLGGVRLLRSPVRSSALLAPLFVLGLTLAHMLVEVAGRYHYSLIPMLILTGQFALFFRKSPEEQPATEGGQPHE